jgi:hypothetical protein
VWLLTSSMHGLQCISTAPHIPTITSTHLHLHYHCIYRSTPSHPSGLRQKAHFMLEAQTLGPQHGSLSTRAG